MATTKKTTKTEYFAMIKDALNGAMLSDEQKAEVMDFIDTQVAQIAAKAEKAKARAAEKKAKGDELRDAVQAVLTNEYQDIDTIMSQIDAEDVTRAKISARLTQLVKAEIAEKEQQKNDEGKKAMFYRLIGTEVEADA